MEPGSTGVLAANTAKVARELEEATAIGRDRGDTTTSSSTHVFSLLSASHTRIMIDMDAVPAASLGMDSGKTTTTITTLPPSSEHLRPRPVQCQPAFDHPRKNHPPGSPDSPNYREGGVRKRAKTATSPKPNTEEAVSMSASSSASVAVLCGRQLVMLQRALQGRSSTPSSSSSTSPSSSAVDQQQGKVGGVTYDDIILSSAAETDDETAACLFAWAVDSWTPFVEYAATLHMLMQSSTSSSTSSASSSSSSSMMTNESQSASSDGSSGLQEGSGLLEPSATYLEQQLKSIGIVALDGGLLHALSLPALSGLFQTWTQQMQSFTRASDEKPRDAAAGVGAVPPTPRGRDDDSNWIPTHEPTPPPSARKKSTRSDEHRDAAVIVNNYFTITSPFASSSSGRLGEMMDVQEGAAGAYPESDEDQDDAAYVNEDEDEESDVDNGEEELDNEEDEEDEEDEEEEDEDHEGDEGMMDFIVDDEGDDGEMDVDEHDAWGGLGPPPMMPPLVDDAGNAAIMGEMPVGGPLQDDALLQLLMNQLGANEANGGLAGAPAGLQAMMQQLQAIIGQGGGELVIPGDMLGGIAGPLGMLGAGEPGGAMQEGVEGGVPQIQIQMGIGPGPAGALPMGMMMGAGGGAEAGGILGLGLPPLFQMGMGGGGQREAEVGAPLAVAPGNVKSLWHMVGVDPLYKHVDGFCYPKEKIPQGLLGTTDIDPLLTRTPLVGSLTGRDPVFGVRGKRLTHGYNDLSHLSVGTRHRGGLISLPHLYTDLHRMATFPPTISSASVDEPAICLLCGAVVQSGTKGTPRAPASVVAPMDIGECTLHARSCGAGIGIFYHLTKVQVLLIRGRLACVYPSVYVDDNGEIPEAHGLLRPMFLSNKAYAKLEELYLTHQVAREVTRHRASADRVLRADWY